MTFWILLLVFVEIEYPTAAHWISSAVVIYALYCCLKSICAVEVHRADKAAQLLYDKQHGKTPGLPEKLRGVFWFDGNPAPELITTLEGTNLIESRQTINLNSGGTYSWTHSADHVGWAYWCCLRVGWACCAELHLEFNEDYTFAKMPLRICGFCPDQCCCDGIWVPMGQWWTMEQEDDDTWKRNIRLYCTPWKTWELGSYTLRRIIRPDNTKTPAFDDMMRSLEEGVAVKGLLKKPMMQVMNGDDWKGYLCFGSGGQTQGDDYVEQS